MTGVIITKHISESLRRVPILCVNILTRNKSVESFKYKDLKIELATEAQKIPKPDPWSLTFADTFSDHMFRVNWTSGSHWGIPQIVPVHHFQCHPGSMVFHYALAVFEGMKAFKCSDGSVNLFRPNLNIERLLASAERATLPLFDGEEFLKCLKKLVSIDKEWIPNYSSRALYIRPTFVGIENSLEIKPSNSALLYIITSPVEHCLLISHKEPISLMANPAYVRAWPGGVGDKKMASNYAPTLRVQKMAEEQGLDQVLWLRGWNHQITEVGAMNVFFFFRRGLNEFELATPALDGTVLPGVMRQSLLDLARNYNEFEVSERDIMMGEIIKAVDSDTLEEMFVCGTAPTLCPVKKIRYLGNDINIPTMRSEKKMYQRLYKSLADIQYGRVESEWTVKID